MGCGCGGRSSRSTSRSTSVPRTSGDYTVAGSYQTPTAPPQEPLAVFALTSGDHDVPADATYKVTTDYQVAYFTGHLPAFQWQGDNGGKLRTVRR